MASPNVDTFREAHQAFNGRDFHGAAGRMTENVVYHDRARGETYQGRDGFKKFMQGWVEAFSNAEVSEPTYIDGGDTVVAQFVGRGVNDGPLGSLPATGNEMEVPMCEILRFDDQGRVVSGSIYYDQLSMMTQLGHMQGAEAAPAG